MKSKHSFSEIVLTCASILLCFTIVSSYLTAGMFARFVSSDTASDSARVATFNVDKRGALTTSFAAEFVPGVPCYKEIIVQNKSEVAIEYTITILNKSNNMKLSFRFGTDENDLRPMTETSEGYTYTTYFASSSKEQRYVLEITWIPSDDPAYDLAYMGAVDQIAVTLMATQVD